MFLRTEDLSLFDLKFFFGGPPACLEPCDCSSALLCWSWWSSDANTSALQSHPVLSLRMATSFVMKNWAGKLFVPLLCLLDVRVQIDHHGVATFVCLQGKSVWTLARGLRRWRHGNAVPSLDHLFVDKLFCDTLGVPLSMAVPFENCCVPFQTLLCFGDEVICATLHASVSSWESCSVHRRIFCEDFETCVNFFEKVFLNGVRRSW